MFHFTQDCSYYTDPGLYFSHWVFPLYECFCRTFAVYEQICPSSYDCHEYLTNS